MKPSTTITRGTLPLHIGGGAVCAVLLAAGWFFGLGPLMSETQQSATITDRYEQAQQAARESQDRVKQLEARLKTVQSRLDEQPVNLEPASAINPLLAELAGWSDRHELSMTRTRSGRPIALAYYDYVPISLAGEGTYPNLLGFMRQLNAARGDLGVVSFDVKRMSTQGGVVFTLDLAWYVVSDPAQPSVPASAGVRVD